MSLLTTGSSEAEVWAVLPPLQCVSSLKSGAMLAGKGANCSHWHSSPTKHASSTLTSCQSHSACSLKPLPCINFPAVCLKWIENYPMLFSGFAFNNMYYEHLWECEIQTSTSSRDVGMFVRPSLWLLPVILSYFKVLRHWLHTCSMIALCLSIFLKWCERNEEDLICLLFYYKRRNKDFLSSSNSAV